MDPFFRLQISISIFTFNHHSDTFYSSFCIFLDIQNINGITFFLSPFDKHSEQHFSPILSVTSSSACMYGQICIIAVIWTCKQSFNSHRINVSSQGVIDNLGLFNNGFILCFNSKINKNV